MNQDVSKVGIALINAHGRGREDIFFFEDRRLG